MATALLVIDVQRLLLDELVHRVARGSVAAIVPAAQIFTTTGVRG